MKKIISLSSLLGVFYFLFPNFISGQTPDLPVDKESGLITYREVINSEGSADDLYVRALSWINEEFKNAADVTKIRDRSNGIIKGIYRFKIYNDDKNTKIQAGVIEYSFILEFKEGRYRYIFTEFLLKQLSRQGAEMFMNKDDPDYNPTWDNYLMQIDNYTSNLINRLKGAMKPEAKADDTW